MNVMAQAHKLTKEFFVETKGMVSLSYARVFKVKLKVAHQEYKAMNKQTPEQAYFSQSIKQAEQRIAELEAISETTGYIVVVGGDIRLPVDELTAKWARVEDCSIYANVEDARYWASKVRNGKGELGQIVNKADQIKWEIEQQQELIETLKTALKG